MTTDPSGSPALSRLAPRSVLVKVPATSANLGPGFDTLGIALSLYDELVVTTRDEPGIVVHVEGVGAGEVPTDETNLVALSIVHAFTELGQPVPGLELRARNVIPHGRGSDRLRPPSCPGSWPPKAFLTGSSTFRRRPC